MGKVSKALEKSGYSDNESGTERFSNSSNPSGERKMSEESSQEAAHFVDDQFASQEEIGAGWDERLDAVYAFSSHLSESFRMLRARILYPDDGSSPPRTILVTSASPSEGKSFVAANLGIVIAQGVDQYAMLVGCDLRKPALAKLFGMSNRYGLSDYLLGKASIEKLIQPTTVERLSVLPAGLPPANPAELLGSEKMRKMVHELSNRYDDRLVIFDSPPMQVVSETLVLAKQVDGVVLVVRWGASNRTQVKKLVENIGRKKIIGVVFNGFQSSFFGSKILGEYSDTHQNYK